MRNRAAVSEATRHQTEARFVEVLYFDGCPNHEPAVALVERVANELVITALIRLVNVPDFKTAARKRFLGSPTVRVDGRDVEPGADERSDFVLSCRVYQTESGFEGVPAEQWIRDALLGERSESNGHATASDESRPRLPAEEP